MLITYDLKPSVNLRRSHLDTIYLSRIGVDFELDSTDVTKITLKIKEFNDYKKLPSANQTWTQ